MSGTRRRSSRRRTTKQRIATRQAPVLPVSVDAILSSAQTRLALGNISQSTFWRWQQCGFPPGEQIGPRRLGWRVSTVEAWLKNGRAQTIAATSEFLRSKNTKTKPNK